MNLNLYWNPNYKNKFISILTWWKVRDIEWLMRWILMFLNVISTKSNAYSFIYDLNWAGNVTANWLKSQNGTLFSHVWRRGRLALDPLYIISPRSEFFSRAYKNWHIMWGTNLGPDWPPLARGSKFHTIHTPTRPFSFLPLDNGRIWTYRF